jgi:hypothetical protein
MDAQEFIRGWELSISSSSESEEDLRLLKMIGEHLKAAVNYRMGNEHAIPVPHIVAVTPEFPKGLGKFEDGKLVALYKATSLDSQPRETHVAPWMPLRSLAEYEQLKADGVPEWSPFESMTERERRLAEMPT